MSQSTNPPQHIPALDGVRGLAILLILAYHLLWSNVATGSVLLDSVSRIRESCWIGVNLFFVLSGFLITGILYGTVNSSSFFRTFYARRSVRIFPLYYAYLIGLLLLTHPLHFQWNGWQWYYLTYTQNIALWRWDTPLNLEPFNILHFWSLGVEEQFYLVWPFVVYKLRDTRKLLTVSLLGCLASLSLRTFFLLLAGHPHFTNQRFPYAFTPACADNLLFGCALALLIRTPLRKRILALAPPVFFTCAAVLIAFLIKDRYLDPFKPLMGSIGVTILALGCTALVATTLTPTTLSARLFSNAFLRFFGRYSYGLYVYHHSINAFSPTLRAWFLIHFHSKIIGVAGTFFLLAALSTAVAVLSYHLFEIHFLKLKKYFPNTGAQSPAALVR